MVDLVIYFVVIVVCLWQLFGICIYLVVFDISVVDFMVDVVDLVELLMKVQLGGGINIVSVVEYGW